MGRRDDRVDAYMAGSADFARPILKHLRELVHTACPDVEETMKWSRPHFTYHGLLCGMSAFKQHCAFGFWMGSEIVGAPKEGESEPGMGQFGKITRIEDLPPDDVLVGYVRQAMTLNERGVKSPGRTKARTREPRPVVVPDDLATLLAEDEKARVTFDRFPPSHQREYVDWITEAKTAATRSKRLATTLEWLAEGKSRNWKYEKC